MFESITELTNINVVERRERFAIGSGVAVVCWILAIVVMAIPPLFKQEMLRQPSGYQSDGGDLVEITRLTAPLPPTPRIKPETSNRPAGNAMVERDIVTPTAKNDAELLINPQKKPGQEPPSINSATATASVNPTAIVPATQPTLQPAPDPPPTPKNDDQQTQLNVDELKSKIRRSTITDPADVTTGGKKGMRLDGGAGLDLGSNKVLLERRMFQAWQKTKSEYTDMRHAGRSVTVYFDWYRDGRLVFIAFGSTTGNSSLDNEARNAVQNASPFVPIPKDISLDVIRLNATFTY